MSTSPRIDMSTMLMKEARNLALLFHLNSEPWMNQQAYDEPSAPHSFSKFDIIRSRYSCRNFTGEPLSLEQVASLFHRAYGVLGLREEQGWLLHHIPVPSAGALYPLELYAFTQAVEGLPNGLYHYAGWHHRLECINKGVEIAELLPNMQEQRYILGANLLLFLTAVFPRTMTKYGPRGYRYILLEAGQVAQNVCLIATEEKLGTLCLGGFRDSYINGLLQLNPRTEGAIYAIAIGHPCRQL
jgi:SagB-type dehydrogenase family enzyme